MSLARIHLPLFVALLLCLSLTLEGLGQSPAVPAATPAPAAAPAATPIPPAVLPLAEIAPQAQTALAALNALEAEETGDEAVTTIRTSLPDLTSRLNQLLLQGSKVTDGDASLQSLRQMEAAWNALQATLTQTGESLSKRGQVLESELTQIQKMEEQWLATQKKTYSGELAAPAQTQFLIHDVLQAAREARQRVKVRQTSVLELQARLGDLDGRARTGLAAVQQASAEAAKTLLIRDSQPLWAPESKPRPDLLSRWRGSLQEQWTELSAFAISSREVFIVHGMIFAALLGGLYWLQRHLRLWTAEQPRLQRAAPIVDVPIATALGLSFMLLIESSLYVSAPALFRSASAAVALPCLIILLRRLISPRLHPILYTLAGFFLADQVRMATVEFTAFNRWIFCGEMAAAIVVFLALGRGRKATATGERVRPRKWILLATRLGVFLLALALGAVVLGYVRLGALVGQAVLGSSYWALFIYALLRVLSGFWLIALCVGPLDRMRIAQEHRDTIQDRTYTILRLAAVGFWLWKTLLMLQISGPLHRQVGRVLAYPVGSSGFHLTLGSLVSFILAIWLSVQISRLLRFVLEEEAFPRLRLAPGLPYAISTMINYAILVVGFIIALALLGVDLTKVTIVAGAFSVGLGFGLQNIINNFVSGIIILFERPIKIGDMVQVGDSVGEVRRIGIRASIIRTREGSDIIVPNGSFISGQVTNWTYSDRSHSIEIPVTVASGNEPQQVMQLLRDTAAAIPSTKDHPAPQVFITGITASGVSFSIRAWTGRYEDSMQARSDLSAAISAALAKAGIKMV